MTWRIVRRKERAYERISMERPRTIIMGAGETGSPTIDRMMSKDLNMLGMSVVATDDDPSKKGMRIHGVKVAGSTDDIISLADRYGVKQIVVAILFASAAERCCI